MVKTTTRPTSSPELKLLIDGFQSPATTLIATRTFLQKRANYFFFKRSRYSASPIKPDEGLKQYQIQSLMYNCVWTNHKGGADVGVDYQRRLGQKPTSH